MYTSVAAGIVAGSECADESADNGGGNTDGGAGHGDVMGTGAGSTWRKRDRSCSISFNRAALAAASSSRSLRNVRIYITRMYEDEYEYVEGMVYLHL